MDACQSDLEFLSGGGRMGHQIAETDWTNHPMGPISGWGASLRTALSIILNSGFPSCVLWGQEFYVFYNGACATILGDRTKLGQGSKLSELWPEIEEEACRVARAAFSGEAIYFKDQGVNFERFGHSPKAYFTSSFSPIRDAIGAIVGVHGIIVETTASVLEMAQLKHSEEQLQFSLDASGNVGTWTWYPDTNATFVDQRFARLFQVDAALAHSGARLESFTNMIHPDDRQRALAAIDHSVSTGAHYEIDYRIPQRAGQTTWVTAKGKLFIDPETGVRRFAGVAVDITEQLRKHEETKRFAEAAATVQSRQTQFLATLAHELRTPLAPIRTGLELMHLGASDPEGVARMRSMIERQLNQLTHLIDDLLDVSRINNGKVKLQMVAVEIGAAILAASETSQSYIAAAKHCLTTKLPEYDLVVTADPIRLSQILSNILTNAAKYTPAGGQIEIEARCENDVVAISVSDNGVGIPEEALAGVFDMFNQVPKEISRSQGGLGIGLSIVKTLTELHGGTVSVVSPGILPGATFTIRLPLAHPAQPCAFPRRDTVPLWQAAKTSLHVLIADDNQDAADTLAAALEFLGHTVEVAHDGREAWAKVCSAMPQVAFLDIGMPEMSGYELARAIRKMAEVRDITLIALTGSGAEADQALAKEAGFDFHLTKPVSLAAIGHILDMVAAQVHSRELEDQCGSTLAKAPI